MAGPSNTTPKQQPTCNLQLGILTPIRVPHHRRKKRVQKPGTLMCGSYLETFITDTPTAQPRRAKRKKPRLQERIDPEIVDAPTFDADLQFIDDDFPTDRFSPPPPTFITMGQRNVGSAMDKKLRQWARWQSETIPSLVSEFCEILRQTNHFRDDVPPVDSAADACTNANCKPRSLNVMCLDFDCEWHFNKKRIRMSISRTILKPLKTYRSLYVIADRLLCNFCIADSLAVHLFIRLWLYR